MNHEATAKVMHKKSTAAKGKAQSVEFERLKNGVTSNTRYAHPDDPESPYGGQSEKMVHPSMAHAKKHLAACLGDANDKEAAEGEAS